MTEEDRRLRDVVEQCKGAGARVPWAKVAAQLPDRTDNGCKRRYLQLAKGLPEGTAQCAPPLHCCLPACHAVFTFACDMMMHEVVLGA